MQDKKVVHIRGNRSGPFPPPVTDFWFALVEKRLGQIERMMRRLEWQIWAIVCGAALLLFFETMQFLSPAVK